MGGFSPPTSGLLAINYSYPVVRAGPLRTIYAASTTLHARGLPCLPSVQGSVLSPKNGIFDHCVIPLSQNFAGNCRPRSCVGHALQHWFFLPSCDVDLASFTPGDPFTFQSIVLADLKRNEFNMQTLVGAAWWTPLRVFVCTSRRNLGPAAREYFADVVDRLYRPGNAGEDASLPNCKRALRYFTRDTTNRYYATS